MSFSTKIDKPQPKSSIIPPSLTVQRKSFNVPNHQDTHDNRSIALQRKNSKSSQYGHNLSQFSISYSPSPIQTKLTIGQPGDRYEQEADQVAAQVMSMSQPQSAVQKQEASEEEEMQMKPLANRITPLIQRQEMPEEEEMQMKPEVQRQEIPEEEEMQMKPEVQRQEIPEEEELQAKSMVQRSGSMDHENLEQNLSNSKGGGSPLPDETRGFMESRFGADFSGVRIHNDSTANQMNQSIQAQAFTHGQDIYFNSGKYSPDSHDGKTLLAHELTHVVQQTGER